MRSCALPPPHWKIERAETLLGASLPFDLRESLLCHNGDESRIGVLPCGQLYSTEQVIEIRSMRMDIWEPEDPDDQQDPWWGALWIPFAGGDGDEHFIEAGPGTWHNHLGHAPHDDTASFLGWPSLGTWLHAVAEAMEHHNQPDHAIAAYRPMLRGNGEVDW
ncbi:SMI1/KNR4 family protein [Kitasatospora sp. P5_F3]